MKLALFVHGAGGGGWEWEAWTREFRESGWEVKAPDLQPSPAGLEATTLDDYVAQIEAFVPDPKPEVFVIAGASLGGLIALKVLERRFADACILVNSVPPRAVNWKADRIYPEVVRWQNRSVQESREAMPDCEESTILYAAEHWRDESGGVLNAVALGVEAAAPHCPALAVVGARDTDVPLEVSLAVAGWAGAQIHLYNQLGHLGPLMGPDSGKVATAALRWLKHLFD